MLHQFLFKTFDDYKAAYRHLLTMGIGFWYNQDTPSIKIDDRQELDLFDFHRFEKDFEAIKINS